MKKRIVTLVLAIAATASITNSVTQAAAEGSWPAQLGNTSNNVTFTQPNGNVTVAGCGKGTREQRTFNSSGTQISALQQTASPQFYTCEGQSDAAPDGTVYTVRMTANSSEVVAVHGSQVVGHAVQVGNLCSANSTGSVVGLRYTPHGVYVLLEHSRWPNCPSKYLLVRIDTQSGKVTQQVPIQGHYVQSEGLRAARQYVVVESDQAVQYVPYNYSAASGVTSVQFETRSWTAAQVATTYDAMSYVAHEATTPNAKCGSSNPQFDKVAAYDPENTRSIWSYKLPACTYGVTVYVAPFDIAVLSYYVLLPDGSKRFEVAALNIDGERMWQPRVLGAKTRSGSNYTNDPYGPLLHVDNNGNIVLRRVYWYKNSDRMVAFQFLSLFSGELIDEYLTEKVVASGDQHVMADYPIGLTNGRLYFSMQQKLYAVNVAKMGMEYPRAAVYGIEPQPIRDEPYVALGDSFSSGEGVPPFSLQAPDCHQSARAYSRLLGSDIAAKLTLTGFGACSGAVTDDVTNTVDGRPPANGLPAQETLLGDSTKVVSITIGGNDVEFLEYVVNCVAIPMPIGSCDRGSSQYKRTMDLAQYQLPARLDKVYTAIKQRAPKATVYAVGYPQVVSAETTPVYPGTCRYLTDSERFAARTVVTNLNYQISQAVARINQKGGNFRFVSVNNTGSPFIGHELCTDDAYFNGLTYPLPYTFHPNVHGQAVYAELVKEAITN